MKRQTHQRLAPCGGQQGAARVGKRGHRIDQPGPLRHRQQGQTSGERVHIKALLVNRGSHDLRVCQAQGLDGGGVSRRFDTNRITGLNEDAQQQVKRLLGAGGHDEIRRAACHAARATEQGQRLAQRRHSLGGAILQGAAIRQRSGRCILQSFSVKQAWRRIATGERDDAGLA